jgi:hypothetical protein
MAGIKKSYIAEISPLYSKTVMNSHCHIVITVELLSLQVLFSGQM